REFLRGRLPDYMVPSQWIALDELPLLSTGKLDRRALPSLARPGQTRDNGSTSDASATEAIVAGIWRDVLGLSHVGVNDDFFELGGHSLLATQVLSRIQAAFPVDLGLRAIFEAPTVAVLARTIDASVSSDAGDDVPVSPARPVEEFTPRRLTRRTP